MESEADAPSQEQTDIRQVQIVKDIEAQPSRADLAEARQQAAQKVGLQRLASLSEKLSRLASQVPEKPPPTSPNTTPKALDRLTTRLGFEQGVGRAEPSVIQSAERRADPDAIESVKELATQVEDVIKAAYGISKEGLAGVADNFWDGSDDELLMLLTRYRARMLNPRGANYTIDEGDWHGCIVYLAPDLIERLAGSSSAELLTNPVVRRDFSVLIEEVSHFIYSDYYRKIYGIQPHSALLEMIAVLDEYNVFQYLTGLTQGRVLSEQEHVDTLKYNAAAFNQVMKGARSGVYLIGHEMGVQYLLYLNYLHNQGQDAGTELSSF